MFREQMSSDSNMSCDIACYDTNNIQGQALWFGSGSCMNGTEIPGPEYQDCRRRFQTFGYTELTCARRQRLTSSVQRKVANLREKRRMMNLKDAFRALRDCLPVMSYKKKMSRIETLRLAIVYIKFLQEFADSEIEEQNKLPGSISLPNSILNESASLR